MGMGKQHNLIASIIKIVFVGQVTENRDSYPWNINCDFATVTPFTPLGSRSISINDYSLLCSTKMLKISRISWCLPK